MKRSTVVASVLTGAIVVAMLPAFGAGAPVRVQYGRITHIQPVTVTDSSAQMAGTLIGGVAGLASGSGQSSSNRALRVAGGAAAGRGLGNLASRSQAFEYTVLIDGRTTTRITSDQVGKRVGDCVAVEQGEFANIRLADESRCVTPPAASGRAAATPRPAAPAPAPAAADVQAASACEQAKNQVLAAATDEEFNLAERRMRLLCGE
jgi:outer membrane lipoprotein SlyB